MTDLAEQAKAMSESLRRGACAPQSAAPVRPQPGTPGDRRGDGGSFGQPPAKVVDEPFPDLSGPFANATHPVLARPVGDEQAWRIARSVGAKIVSDKMGDWPMLSETWTRKVGSGTAEIVNAIARMIVTGE